MERRTIERKSLAGCASGMRFTHWLIAMVVASAVTSSCAFEPEKTSGNPEASAEARPMRPVEGIDLLEQPPPDPGAVENGPAGRGKSATEYGAGAVPKPPAQPAPAAIATPFVLEPKRAEIGGRAIAIESIECRPDGEANFVLYVGEAVDLGSDQVQVLAEKRFAAKYTPLAAGVDSSEWWCIPRRRYCYSEVSFADWRGTRRAGDMVVIPQQDAFHFDWGIERTLKSASELRCRP